MPVVVPDSPSGRLGDAWRRCVGTGRFELALRRDYTDSLALIQRDIGFRHIRGHGLFSDGVGVYRPYEFQGARHVRYTFTYVDQVIDAYLDLGIAPFLELGFMPAELASGSQTVFWWGRQHHASPVLDRLGRPGPGPAGAPDRPLRRRSGAPVADRGVERAEPQGVLARRRPGRLPHAVRGDRAHGQGRGRLAAWWAGRPSHPGPTTSWSASLRSSTIARYPSTS
jgi:hypothetical protein